MVWFDLFLQICLRYVLQFPMILKIEIQTFWGFILLKKKNPKVLGVVLGIDVEQTDIQV